MRRAGDYPEATDAELRGRTLPVGGTTQPPPMGYENPGATPNMRGVEANTDRSKGDPLELPPMMGAGKHGELDGDASDSITGDPAETFAAGVDAPKIGPRSSDYGTQGSRDWGTAEHRGDL